MGVVVDGRPFEQAQDNAHRWRGPRPKSGGLFSYADLFLPTRAARMAATETPC